ncbi:MAG: cache domain-containing protein [Mogibacterium sp.]|nr:cache domain-containing protein [Mogibacterium sp.]
MNDRKKQTRAMAITGAVIVLLILVAGTFWMGHAARQDTDKAVHTVSLLYLDELAGRREQVVESNLENRIETIQIAVDLMTDEDLSDEEHRQAYQKRMKALYHLDKFAFVGESGTVYLSTGPSDEIGNYSFDYKTMMEPDISILNMGGTDKKVVIAVPIEPRKFKDDRLVVCFMETSMEQMLHGVSMDSSEDDATFCNLYTSDGYPLSNAVLGGFAVEANLFDALEHAEFDPGYSREKVISDFESAKEGEASFIYGDRSETLTYVPVAGTDWLLTYLVRESLISDMISDITSGIIVRSTVQSVLMMLALLAIFGYILGQSRRNAKIMAEYEASETEARVKQEEMEQRLALQEELLAEREQAEQQDRMIKALASDYRSVYYLELDKDEGICYQARSDMPGFKEGDKFKYLEAVTAYCNN